MKLRNNKTTTTSTHVHEQQPQCSLLVQTKDFADSNNVCSVSQTSTRKFVGVSKLRDGYCARIPHPVSGKQIWLGTFKSPEEASMAVLAKKTEFEKEQRIEKGVCDEEVNKVVDQSGSCSGVKVEESQHASLQIDSRKSRILKRRNIYHEQRSQGGVCEKKDVDQYGECLGGNCNDPCKKTQDSSLQIGSRNSKRKKSSNLCGVNKSKSGKYTARIRHPISKEQIWLGTFGSAEEASMVWSAKKTELEKEIDEKERRIEEVVCDEVINKVVDQSGQCSVENHTEPGSENQVSSLQIDSRKERISKKKKKKKQDSSLKIDSRKAGILKKKKKKCQDSSLQIDARKANIAKKKKSFVMSERIVGVTKSKSGKYYARIKHPISRKDIWLGTFRSAEEASMAYLTRKTELEKEVKGKEGGRTGILSPISEKSTCLHDQDCTMKIEPVDPLNGESASRMEELPIQRNVESVEKELSADSSVFSEYGAEILLRTESGVPLMDSHGFLLGSWSWIDDLSLPIL